MKTWTWRFVAMVGAVALSACSADDSASSKSGADSADPEQGAGGEGASSADEDWNEGSAYGGATGGSASGGAYDDWSGAGGGGGAGPSGSGGELASGAYADAGVPDNAGGSAYAPPPPDQAGEQYQDYGDNPFTQAAEDRFATFAIDVDTASYTLMRRDVTAGVLPVPEGVRVEEYVNFFRYDDAPPTAQDPFPFAIHLEATASPFGPGLKLMRVNLTGRAVDPAALKPANLIFLVDVSGSMQSPDKIGMVQYTLNHLVEQLRPSDTIGIVRYAGDVGVALPPTAVEDVARIHAAIDGLTAGGSTNGEAGIRMAYDEAARAFRPEGINRVILCTDGDFNVGLTGAELYALIEEERERGITLSTLGFGSGNYNDRDMEQLADRGNGNYAYIDGVREADRIVQRDLSGTLQVIAKDVKIQVELNPSVVQAYRLVGYENRAVADDDFRDDAVDGGEIGAGHQVTAFLELRLLDGLDPAMTDHGLATVFVRAKDPDGQTARETSAELRVNEIGADPAEASANFRFGAAVAEAAEILRGSPYVDLPAHQPEVLGLATAAAGDDEDRREFVMLWRRVMDIWAF